MAFRDWVAERFAPCVMVIATPEAESMCRDRNGLSVVNTLRPFGVLPHLSVPVRTVGEQAYRINEFRLRFHEASTMHMPTSEVTEEHLKAVLTNRARLSRAEDNIDLIAALGKGELPQQTPWFEEFRQEFFRLLSFSDLEAFDHPVACLLVVHADAADPLRAAGDLLVEANLPPLMAHGVMESKLPRHCLLLHDAASPAASLPAAEERLRSLAAELGEAACHLVTLNSGAAGQRQFDAASLFRPHLRPSVPGGGAGEPAAQPAASQALGACLSDSDLKGLAAFVEDLTLRSLLPSLEARIRALYHQVMAARRGVRNQLKNLLWRSAKAGPEAPRPAGGGPPFGADSPEGQMRALADLAFCFQDHETCLSTLRALAADLRAERDWRHYAAAQEMLGLAACMAGQPAATVTGHFREAFARYDSLAGQGGWDARHLATRSQLLLAGFCCSAGLWSEANAALMRAQSQEENLIAAVLLEQAALCLLHARVPGVRKWAFHLVLAALRFSNCQQPQLANRAYRQVTRVFEGRGWGHIEAHLQEMLGRHAAETGARPAAARHFAAALTCAGAAPARQRALLRAFEDCVARLTPEQAQELAAHLPLPRIDAGSVEVVHDDSVTYATAAARTVPGKLWRGLEGPLLAGQGGGGQEAAAGSRARLAARTVVAGEAVGVFVSMRNPLGVPLEVCGLRVAVQAASGDQVQVAEHAVTLQAGEAARVRLEFKALQPGELSLAGVRWRLAGGAAGYTPLRERSAGGAGDGSLAFSVVPAMPQLQAEVEGLEGAVYADELVRCQAVLRNAGAVPLRGLRLALQQPDLHCCASDAGLPAADAGQLPATELAGAEAGGEESARLAASTPVGGGGRRVHAWPAELAIPPGACLRWPLLLHPRAPGLLALHASWRYEGPAGAGGGLPWRVLRWSQALDVQPLLALEAAALPSGAGLQACLLHLQLRKAEAAARLPLQVTQVACASPGWQLAEVAAGTGSTAAPALAVSVPVTSPSTSAVFQLSRRSDASAEEPPGGPLAGGVLAELRAERRRLRRLPSSAGGAPREGDGAAAGPAEQAGGGLDLAVSWRFRGPIDGAEHAGVSHLWDCPFPEAAVLRARLVGAMEHRWDFARGPLLAALQLQVWHCRAADASVCCETGTSPDLHAPDARGVEARRWQMRPAAAAPAAAEPGGAAAGEGSPAPRRSSAGSAGAAAAAEEAAAAGPLGSAAYLWAGATRASIPRLRPGAVAHLPLQVLIFAPGAFQLTDYALFWTFADGGMNTVQPGPPVCLLAEQL